MSTTLNPDENIKKSIQTVIESLDKLTKVEFDEISKNAELMKVLNSPLGEVAMSVIEKSMIEKKSGIAYYQSMLESHMVK